MKQFLWIFPGTWLSPTLGGILSNGVTAGGLAQSLKGHQKLITKCANTPTSVSQGKPAHVKGLVHCAMRFVLQLLFFSTVSNRLSPQLRTRNAHFV